MKNLLLLGLAVVCFSGCAMKRYDITLSGNTIITAKSKPKLVHGYYEFEDTEGKPMRVPAGRVRSIDGRSAFVKRSQSDFSGKFEYR